MKSISLLLCIILTINTFAQTGTVTGALKDGGQQAVIDAASVSLLRASDSSIVKSTVAESDGTFVFEPVKFGKYLLVATSVGYQSTFTPIFTLDSAHPSFNAGTLQLVALTRELANVNVTAKRPLIERKIDRTVVNVDQMISAAGGTALEVLEKSPGITVDKDGKVSLKGKQGVMVMLDGKPTYMSGADLANYLSNMPASSLEAVEIMPNPPAQYDAAGNSGVINLKTKRNRQKGWNGSISSSVEQGQYFRTMNTLNLNYRTAKWNLFANTGGSLRNNRQVLMLNRTMINTHTNAAEANFTQTSTERQHRDNLPLKLGMDFFANKKTTLGLTLNSYYNPNWEKGHNISTLKNGVGQLDSTVITSRFQEGYWKHGGASAYFKHKFDSSGRELTGDVDYLVYKAFDNQTLTNSSYNPAQQLTSENGLIGKLPIDIAIASAKTDYTQTLRKTIKLDVGLKTAFISTANEANYFTTEGKQTQIDYSRTNHFNYKENINAAYVSVGTQYKKWGIQTGLRAEHTRYSGMQHGNPTRKDSSFTNQYFSVFPTAYLTYKQNDQHEYGLNLGRRINRPDYGDLNPFYYFLDKYTYNAGNPYIRPMYSTNLEFSHTYKSFLTTTLNIGQTRNLFGQGFERDNNAIIVRQTNFGKMQSASLSVNAQLPVKKWWMLQWYSGYNYSHIMGEINGAPVNVEIGTFQTSISNQFKFNKGWSAELSGFYQSKGNEGQLIIDPIVQLNAVLQKQILKNKGSLKLGINDFSGPMKVYGVVTELKSMRANFNQVRDSRTIRLTFAYRFGKPAKTEGRRSNGASEEQNRVGGSK